MGFCQSCGRPMGRNDYGTNEDGICIKFFGKKCSELKPEDQNKK